MKNNFPWIQSFFEAMPGVTSDFKPEWGWTRFKLGGKMFAALLKDGEGEDFALTIKADPVEAELARATFWRVFPGYYCDKRCYNSIYLGDPGPDWEKVCAAIKDAASDAGAELPEALLKDMCRRSYALARAALPRKVAAALEIAPDA